jgi:hypothetical protein
MAYLVDLIATVLAADLLGASITGRFVSVGRGGGKNVSHVKRPLIRTALAVAAVFIAFFVAWDIRRKLGN